MAMRHPASDTPFEHGPRLLQREFDHTSVQAPIDLIVLLGELAKIGQGHLLFRRQITEDLPRIYIGSTTLLDQVFAERAGATARQPADGDEQRHVSGQVLHLFAQALDLFFGFDGGVNDLSRRCL